MSWLRLVFVFCVVRPAILLWIGVVAHGREHLPSRGPAIVVANHNSHLDALALLALFPVRALPRVRIVAAADYFMRNRLLAWFVTELVGIVPIERGAAGGGHDPLAACDAVLAAGDILVLFPEGSRGEPETMAEFKRGISHLARRHRDVPVVPVLLRGLGRVLPRGDWIPVPLFCDAFVGEALPPCGDDRKAYLALMKERMLALGAEVPAPVWD